MTVLALTAEGFAAATGVSRETLSRLQAYLAHLEKWNKAINLVGKDTLHDPWRRHFLDSAQIYPLLPISPQGSPLAVLDAGSGAGFPGLVLAIMGGERLAVHLCESDTRKATFLREAARATRTPITVLNRRIEDLPPLAVDVVTARALAPIADILHICAQVATDSTQFLLLKGARTHNELTEAKKNWNIEAALHPSRTDNSGFIVHIKRACRHDRPAEFAGKR